mmetsp:Transcript_20904/g.33483  ORF Transcript_20904/g.33483 Transcript_20904/m.33483 type:complete len:260 (+) Transcript_20904:587-1366(+)
MLRTHRRTNIRSSRGRRRSGSRGGSRCRGGGRRSRLRSGSSRRWRRSGRGGLRRSSSRRGSLRRHGGRRGGLRRRSGSGRSGRRRCSSRRRGCLRCRSGRGRGGGGGGGRLLGRRGGLLVHAIRRLHQPLARLVHLALGVSTAIKSVGAIQIFVITGNAQVGVRILRFFARRAILDAKVDHSVAPRLLAHLRAIAERVIFSVRHQVRTCHARMTNRFLLFATAAQVRVERQTQLVQLLPIHLHSFLGHVQLQTFGLSIA